MAQNTNTQGHAFERVNERLTEAGFDQATRDKFFKVADLLARASKVESEALQLLTLPAQVGQAWGDRSNGNTVVAIVRGARLATVMLRRSTQPFTTKALDVKKVTVIEAAKTTTKTIDLPNGDMVKVVTNEATGVFVKATKYNSYGTVGDWHAVGSLTEEEVQAL